MQTAVAQSRAPAQTPAPATSTVAPATTASNQEVQAAAGLAAGPPEQAGDLGATLVLLGATAVVVLDAMPLALAIPYVIPLLRTPWARAWLAENALPVLDSLTTSLQEQVIDVLLPPGASYEQRFEQTLIVGAGGHFTGSGRLARPHGTWTLTLSGRLLGAAQAGLGAGESAGGVGAALEGHLRVELGPAAELEWVLANAGLTAARLSVLGSLLAGTLPDLHPLVELAGTQVPDRVELTETLAVEGEASLGLDTGVAGPGGGTSFDAAGLVPGLTGSLPLVGALDSVRTAVLGVLEGVEGSLGATLKGSVGYDPDPFVAVEAEGRIAGAAGTAEFGSTMGVRAQAWVMADERGITIVGGTVASTASNNGDSTTVEQPFNGFDGLMERLHNLVGTGAAEDVGELVIDTEHTVEDVAALEAVVGPLERGIDVPLFEQEGEVKARVKVRVAGDTSSAFPAAHPANEEEARDLQRALAGVVTGHAYLADSELREEGVIDAVTLDEAVVESAWEKKLEVEANAAAGLAAEGQTAFSARFATTTDVTQTVALEGVAAMLEA